MKKLMTLSAAILLTACASDGYDKTIAQINAERNSAAATVTAASLQQARMQRQNEIENAILVRQKAALKNSERRESSNVVTDTISNGLGAITAPVRGLFKITTY